MSTPCAIVPLTSECLSSSCSHLRTFAACRRDERSHTLRLVDGATHHFDGRVPAVAAAINDWLEGARRLTADDIGDCAGPAAARPAPRFTGVATLRDGASSSTAAAGASPDEDDGDEDDDLAALSGGMF